MDLVFDFDSRQGITNVRFDGLDGSENVKTVKEALTLLKIRNPFISFSEAVRNKGMYSSVPDAEYNRMWDTMRFISSMWHYPDELGEATQKEEMNVLMLLANTIEALSQFKVLYQIPSETRITPG